MGMQERDWYQRDQREKEYKAAGLKYRNSLGWHYMLDGHDFGPCDKDNICRLMREHTLNDSTLVKQGSGPWKQISKLRKEFPEGGYIYQTGKKAGRTAGKRNFSISIWGIILAALTVVVGVVQNNGIEMMIVMLAASILFPTVIKHEWIKRRSFTALGLISALLLVFLVVYVGVELYWIIVGLE